MLVMSLLTEPSLSTMKIPQTPPFLLVLIPTPLQAPAPAPPWWGSLLKSDNNNVDFKEDNYFNRERDNYVYLYEGNLESQW